MSRAAYWKDWYHNKGGREKVKVARYNRYHATQNEPIKKHIKFE